MDNQLALLGGEPILKEPFPIFNAIGEEEKEAVARVMDTRVLSDFIGRAGEKFLGGEQVLAFEKKMTEMLNVKHAVSVNSATTALQAAVTAIGVGPGDEVITSPFTMSATATAILYNNAIPVFADIDPKTFCLDPKSIEENISEKTKAILVVNIFGGSADYDAILAIAKKHNLKVIEDNAQAIGGEHKGKLLGTIGDIGVFSFNVHKHLQSGEGGVLVTNNDDYALRAQMVRNHAEVIVDDYVDAGGDFYPIIGNNFRLSELHAAVAIEQLKKMEKLNTERIALADHLTDALKQFDWIDGAYVMPETKHVYYVYPLTFHAKKIDISRKAFADAMKAEGFPLNVGYLKPLHMMPVYQKKQLFPNSQFPFVSDEYPSTVSYEKGICPVTEKAFEENFLLTGICYYPRTTEDIDMFVAAIKKIEENKESLANYEQE